MARRLEQIPQPPPQEFVDLRNLNPELPIADMDALLDNFPNTKDGRAAKDNFLKLCREYMEEVAAQKRQSVSGSLQHHGKQRAAKHNDIRSIIGKLSTSSRVSNIELFSRLGDKNYITEILDRYFKVVDFGKTNKNGVYNRIKEDEMFVDPDLAKEIQKDKNSKKKNGSA
ncbi:hypothetical protein KKA15_02640 [Patescibacteria group bacterium]|nr:hypothetical protein [Patescibacteria group bacterium]